MSRTHSLSSLSSELENHRLPGATCLLIVSELECNTIHAAPEATNWAQKRGFALCRLALHRCFARRESWLASIYGVEQRTDVRLVDSEWIVIAEQTDPSTCGRIKVHELLVCGEISDVQLRLHIGVRPIERLHVRKQILKEGIDLRWLVELLVREQEWLKIRSGGIEWGPTRKLPVPVLGR